MLPNDFINLVRLQEWKTVIDLVTVEQAKLVVQYYIDQKFYLSNYSKDENGNFVYATLKNSVLKSSEKIQNDNSGKSKSSLEKKILLSPGEYVFLDDLNHISNKIRSDDFKKASEKLSEISLGVFGNFKETEASRKGKSGFKKIDLNTLDNDHKLNFINNLLAFGVTVNDYNAALTQSKPQKKKNDNDAGTSQSKTLGKSTAIKRKIGEPDNTLENDATVNGSKKSKIDSGKNTKSNRVSSSSEDDDIE
jgi:hypothetical protein